ncbi:MAG: imidazolonepropionase [Candidatus Aminicenantes bacterium]|nr:imidazolonepropionase [Candidatus Aminicenantes bacterium]
MILADCIVSRCNQLLTCRGPIPKRKDDLKDVGVLANGSIASSEGKIVFVGEDEDLKKNVQLVDGGKHIDGQGYVGLPGFVDSHTHLPFAGSREEEFKLRLEGHTYQQLAEKGMGIQTTVNATREATREDLVRLSLERLDSMLTHGTTTTEAKSGYGLNIEDELKQLYAIRQANNTHPIDIVSTFMGAHEVPKEYRSRKEDYIEILTQEILPRVRENQLAEFFDVFCEEGVYSIEETRHLIRTAKAEGFKIKLHADEFAPLGGAVLAAEEGAVSADHLIAISDEGIDTLARSQTVATLLPGVSFFLMQDKKAPARKLIDKGAIVALATDFNPGSSMTESLFFVMQLAVFTLKMGVEEAVNAVTANASYALTRDQEIGSLEVGKKMDLVLCRAPHYLTLVYHFGINPIKHVIKNGNVVLKDGIVMSEKNGEA